MRDAHTDYFFDRLPKGTYVLEETAFIDREGRYTTGLTRIQCVYAPEYGGHTAAGEVMVKAPEPPKGERKAPEPPEGERRE